MNPKYLYKHLTKSYTDVHLLWSQAESFWYSLDTEAFVFDSPLQHTIWNPLPLHIICLVIIKIIYGDY